MLEFVMTTQIIQDTLTCGKFECINITVLVWMSSGRETRSKTNQYDMLCPKTYK